MLNERIAKELDIIYQCVSGSKYNWIDVKKILIRSLPQNLRKGFSKRDPKTKIPKINKFELTIIKYWNKKYEEELPLRGDEVHE